VNWLWQVVDPANIGAFFAQVQLDMQSPAFWLAVGKIIWINVLLSGDNALVIALACHGLPASQRLWGMLLGATGAVALRIALTSALSPDNNTLIQMILPTASQNAGDCMSS